MSETEVLALSLISHTNAGKTTLARTLLRRDVGQVLDQAHVTEESERHVLLELPAGREGGAARIELWDTPGFGDSARLYAALEGREDPLAWLAQQPFDGPGDRPLRSSQRAVRNVAEHADVVLYLVNASEDPGSAGYVEPEMRILGWIGRPVIALLNQTGPPVGTEERRRDEERWRWHLASHAAVRDVISLDAFTRCWVQEGLLLLRIQALVPERHASLMAALLERWREQGERTLAESAEAMADLLWTAARDREPLGESLLPPLARRRAAGALAQRLAAAARRCSDRLIALHGLDGESAVWARGQLQDLTMPGQKPDPLRASVVGGALGGALGGLAADLGLGGLSLGGGAIAGALLGGFGLGGLAWAYEQLGEAQAPHVVWSDDYLGRLVQLSLLRYLAVAHFGRGTGRYRERPDPGFWTPAVARSVEPQARTLRACWSAARNGDGGGRDELVRLFDTCMRRCLVALYPGVERFLEPPRG